MHEDDAHHHDKPACQGPSYTSEKEKNKLVHMGLQASVKDHLAKGLIALGGTMSNFKFHHGADCPETQSDSKVWSGPTFNCWLQRGVPMRCYGPWMNPW